MKLLCINTQVIRSKTFMRNGKVTAYDMYPEGLKEGEIYETDGKPFPDPEHGALKYYIKGLGTRLCCRFTEVLETSFISKKSLEEINQN